MGFWHPQLVVKGTLDGQQRGGGQASSRQPIQGTDFDQTDLVLNPGSDI